MVQIYNQMLALQTARRLFIKTERLRKRLRGEVVKDKTPLDDFKEDQVFFSGNAKALGSENSAYKGRTDVKIKLSDLVRRLKKVNKRSTSETQGILKEQTVVITTKIETEINIEIDIYSSVKGLVRRNNHGAETDRYYFEFQNGTTFKILDKWSGLSTIIWGDPHVDTSYEGGSNNGDFKDLKSSNIYTTYKLEDGSQVTFTALDAGIIENVDIIKGSQHIHGIGRASNQWGQDTQLFSSEVTNLNAGTYSNVPLGDIVYAGGDGNDWFDSSGSLIWWETTGSIPRSKPYARVTYNARQIVEEEVVISSVEKQI